jgi:hypothetical protein
VGGEVLTPPSVQRVPHSHMIHAPAVHHDAKGRMEGGVPALVLGLPQHQVLEAGAGPVCV